MKRSRDWSPAQASLLPPSPMDWLKEDHLVYFLLDLLPTLDLSEIEKVIRAKDPRGERPYSPRMMVGLLLYGYCVGTVSSRKLEKATYEDVAFRVLCAGNHPDHTVISNFRKRHLKALGGLFHQILRLCRETGLVKLGHVALDGTKLKANASKRKANSYKGLEQSEAKLADEVKELLKLADETDAAEDERFGAGQTGEELPKELVRREDRLRAIAKAKAALEADAAKTRALDLGGQASSSRAKADEGSSKIGGADARAGKAEERRDDAVQEAIERAGAIAETAEERASELNERATSPAEKAAAKKATQAAEMAKYALAATIRSLGGNADEDENDDDTGGAGAQLAPDVSMPERHTKADTDGFPVESAQYNFTDPDSQVMKDNGGFSQAYNCQAAVDEEHQIIVAAALSNQANDSRHLPPMLNRVIANCEAAPEVLTADAGYSSEENLRHCDHAGVDAYIPSTRKQPAPLSTPDASSSSSTPPESLTAAMAMKLATKRGQETYRRRKYVGEAPFGCIKEARGFRRLLLRGIEQVRDEWNLICTGHNLLKLFRATGA